MSTIAFNKWTALGRLAGLLAGLWMVSAAANAGALYKCTSGDGIANYVSKRIAGARCDVVSRYSATTYATGLTQTARPSTPSTQIGAAVSSEAITMPAPINGGAGAGTASTNVTPAATIAVPAKVTSTAAGTKRVVNGQLYSYMKDGVRHYSSSKPRGVASAESLRTIKYSFIETCYACGNPTLNFGILRLNTMAFQSEIAAAARQFGVEEAIVRAIIHAESSYNPLARSHVGAQGLMQLMPATARRFGVNNAYDAGENIRGGVQYLSWLLKRYKGDLTLAAAGYNAGEGAVDRYHGVPPYKETQRYVQRVGVLADRYRGAVLGSGAR